MLTLGTQETSGVIGSLKPNPDYRCSRCKGTARPIDRRPHNEWLLMQDKKLDVVDSFCYLGDTIGAGGGCDLSVLQEFDLHGASSGNSCQY